MLAKLNAHPRDKRIQFCAPVRQAADGSTYTDHFYIIDGEIYRNRSVTPWMKEYFADNFDAAERSRGDVELQAKWKRIGAESVEFGVYHHGHFENFKNGLPFQVNPKYPDHQCYQDLPGWPHFVSFMQSVEPWWVDYRTEWPIFSKQVRRPGTIDLVMRDARFPDELVLMVVDYKMKKNPLAAPFCSCGAWGATTAWEHSDGCSAVGSKWASRGFLRVKARVDSVQCCLYSKILEDLYGARVTKMVVAYLHPGTPEEPYPMYLHEVDRTMYHDLICDMFESSLIKSEGD
jgi:hypothetical protein